MRVEHKSPSSDLEPEVGATLHFETPESEVVTITRWSLSHLVWPQAAPACPDHGTLTVPFQGVCVRFPVKLKPDPETGETLFDGLTGRQRETLALFYRSLLSGHMVSVDQVITSLDTPLDLVPMEETKAEAAKALAGKLPLFRKLRAVVHVLTYVAIMTLVVVVVGNNVLTNLDRIDIQHGRIQASLLAVPPSAEGVVERVHVKVGDSVERGAPLLSYYDRQGHALIADSLARLGDAQARVANAQAALDQLQQYEARSSLAMGDPPLGQPPDGDAPLSRVETDFETQQISSQTAYYAVQQVLRDRQLDLEQRQAQHEALIGAHAVRALVAPRDGIVTDVQAHAGMDIAKGSSLVAIESHVPRLAVGWISEKFAETIYLGMPARIRFNTDGKKQELAGTVVDVQAGGIPERPGEFGIIVTVRANDLSPAQSRDLLRLGAPVNLEAERQIVSGLRNFTTSAMGWALGWVWSDV